MTKRGGARPGAGRKPGSVSSANGVCLKFPELKIEWQIALLRITQVAEEGQRAMASAIIEALRRATNMKT